MLYNNAMKPAPKMMVEEGVEVFDGRSGDELRDHISWPAYHSFDKHLLVTSPLAWSLSKRILYLLDLGPKGTYVPRQVSRNFVS
ncbi:hypothetical protein J6590_076864 [Homalodisca vitripennis]|nr:hypothetical protein J6590_076864 [Homalodisca vitripennis]